MTTDSHGSSRGPEPVAADHDAHAYDGIIEHDNKLPLWWQLTLYGAIVFAMVYWFGRRLDAIETPLQAYTREVAVQRAADAEEARKRGTIDDAMLATLGKDPATIAQGKAVFTATCAPCHRADAGGNIGPNLTDPYWLHGSKPVDIFHTVHDGVPAKGMPTWGPQLGEDRVETVVAYVLSIRDANVAGGKAPQGALEE
jgi:cytochrome c oxidase cbb3-type subunit 3